jgi:2-succinyl-5-enolpyruvyl-6-hydroxy-3-cyclohexene-1-carboxylate synthase
LIFDAPNNNRCWADLLVEECIRCGVDFFCLAPGARSTPLVTAVAAHPKARSLVHFDERGTAFAALGYARATGRPAAWITTSGTAVANGLPAVVEAALDGVPMLLLTADRPPELRHTGANQTIDQVRLFGEYVRWFFDLPAPDAALDPAMVLTTVDQAVYRAQGTPAGPVHLNLMFREPLAPDSDDAPRPALLARLHDWYARGTPWTRYSAPVLAPPDALIASLCDELAGVQRGLVIAGRLETAAQGRTVAALAEALGWPLLPDIGSQVRPRDAGTGVACYDALLATPAFAATYPPEAVLHVGGRFVSKRLLQYLERTRPSQYVVVQPNPYRYDPTHQVTHRVEADIVAFCTRFRQALPERTGTAAAWRGVWQRASQQVDALWQTQVDAAATLSEPQVARLVSRHLPDGHGLVLASSMPVRDMDLFVHPGLAAGKTATNRGASGIDGTVATAAGVARGLEAPVTLVLGDLALLHDLNALALLRDQPVTVVVLNNNGGGIFSFLPIARHAEVFEPFFGTPHGLTFAAAASLFGLGYAAPSTPTAFVDAYRHATRSPTPTLLEVTTDRTANVALHRDLLAQVAARIG